MDDDTPLTLRRALVSPEYWLLIVAAIASTAGLSPWIVIPLSVAGLSISSLPKYIALWPRARAVGADRMWWSTLALSMFNNLATSCAAFVFGIAMRWLWL
jgi:hypothetical protein